MKAVSLIIVALLLAGCGVVVKTHHGFMGPSTYEATNGMTSVYYYNGDCCCVAEKVLESLAKKANDGVFDWDDMADVEFKKAMLARECAEIRKASK